MKVCSTVRETTKIDATTSAAVIPTAKPTPASRRVMNRLSMMPERASADFGPENRYSQTSAGVFPTRGPTWGEGVEEDHPDDKQQRRGDGNRGEESQCSSYRSHFCAPGALVHGVTSWAIAATTAYPRPASKAAAIAIPPRSRDVVRRLSGR